jgi:hypothetical protein
MEGGDPTIAALWTEVLERWEDDNEHAAFPTPTERRRALPRWLIGLPVAALSGPPSATAIGIARQNRGAA